MSNVESVVECIDWDLLRKQKEFVWTKANNDQENSEVYEGLLCLIDAIQDAAVADEIATVDQVFGKRKL